MSTYNVPLSDDRYGELFFYLDPGYIFFPYDFYHPLARRCQEIADSMQRSRLRDPPHKENHGHLNHFDAEVSFRLLLDKNFEAESSQADILGVVPSILHLIGINTPSTMLSKPVFWLPVIGKNQ